MPTEDATCRSHKDLEGERDHAVEARWYGGKIHARPGIRVEALA